MKKEIQKSVEKIWLDAHNEMGKSFEKSLMGKLHVMYYIVKQNKKIAYDAIKEFKARIDNLKTKQKGIEDIKTKNEVINLENTITMLKICLDFCRIEEKKEEKGE